MSIYPENDDQFSEHTIEKVTIHESGDYTVEIEDGLLTWVEDYEGGPPVVGKTIRLYSKGMGFPIRGVFIDGVRVRYFTEDEYFEKYKLDQFGASAQDWLDRWDAGKNVWSVEMGGLGPGYEQVIQITAAEILRKLLGYGPDFKFEEVSKAQEWRYQFEKELLENEVIQNLNGVTGAQFGAAKNIAFVLFRHGPVDALSKGEVKDRLIQVNKDFPNPYEKKEKVPA